MSQPPTEKRNVEGPKLVSAEQMRRVDQVSIEEYGIPGHELMDRAGARVVEAIRDRWGGLAGLRVAVVCGKGNNGGDGLVVARRLHQTGVDVDLLLLDPLDAFSGDAAVHAAALMDTDLASTMLEASPDFSGCDLVVDAILGTGLRGEPRPRQATVIDALNRCGCPIVAIDLPSGVNADTGVVPGAAIRAVLTVTFDLPKIAHLFYPARELCGDLALTQIGFPEEVIDACESRIRLLTSEAVGRFLPQRAPTAHKGSCGSVTVIAGSAGMTGAAALTAEAALRAGAGRVRLGSPASLHDILETKVTEAMTHPLPEVRRYRCLSLRGLGAALELIGSCDAVALGPGLGRHRETVEFVRRILMQPDLPPMVLDADGLYALGDDRSLLSALTTPLVLTPHVGEMERLSGRPAEQILADPVGSACELVEKTGVVVLLKGAPTVVAAPDGRVFVNPTGNSGMATAGAGDVLTGLIAGLLAQGVAALEAACLGAFLHGTAGDLARDEQGEWGLIAGDLLKHLPASFIAARRASVEARDS